MKVLVTGAGGVIGYSLVSQLIAQGDEVLCYTRRDYANLRQMGASIIRGDLRDAAALSSACRNVDVVFHLACGSDIPTNRKEYCETTVNSTRQLISACYSHGVSRLVFTSGASVVVSGGPVVRGDESMPYVQSGLSQYQKVKVIAEELVLEANGNQGLTTVALRPNLIWGPRERRVLPFIVRKAAKGQLRILDNGYHQMGISYADNVAYAHVLAARAEAAKGKAYFIQDEQPVILWDWLNYLFEGLGLSEVRDTVHYKHAYRVLALSEKVQGIMGLTSDREVVDELVELFHYDRFFSTDAAQRDLGYRPLVSIEEGIQRTINGFIASDWFKALMSGEEKSSSVADIWSDSVGT